MIFNYSISTPANTAASAPLITDLPLSRGIIHQVEIIFPPGPQKLLHATIHDAVHQVFPTNPEEDFASDNEEANYRVHHPLLREPYSLQVHTWNLDDTYPHGIIVRFGILPKAVVSPWLQTFRERLAPGGLGF